MNDSTNAPPVGPDGSAGAPSLQADPARLDAVALSGLLDTPPEEAFDATTRLARRLLGAPVSFLSVIDAGRDFYKSHCGFGEPLASQRQLEGPTFCHLAIAQPGPLMIPDTHADVRWRSVPTVQSLGVRAYLGVPLRLEGQPIGSLCVIDMAPHDWTAHDVEVLSMLALSVEREVQLRGALAKARRDADEARDAARRLERTMAFVSHDLRTPLMVLQLGVQRLQRMELANAEPVIGSLMRSVDTMKQLSGDLLAEYASAVTAARPRHPLAVPLLLEEAGATMEPVATRAGIGLRVQIGAGVEIVVNYGQLLRALCNLIGNSIKYCAAGAIVTLQATARDRWVDIVVADDGPGMSADEQSRAFEPGWRHPATKASRDGAGLGLSIVREMVEANGGQVRLAAEPGHGTAVTLTLPCRPLPRDGD